MRETAQRVLDRYVDEDVVEVVTDTMGVSNLTYFARCASDRRYVLRHLRAQTAESVRAEAVIQRHLLDAGIGSPLYLAGADGAVVTVVDEQQWTAAERVAGEHPARTTPALVVDIGRTLARLHQALPPAVIPVAPNAGQWLDPHNARRDAGRAPATWQSVLHDALAGATAVLDPDLPAAVIHGEFGSNNFFADSDRVTVVFDWETAQHAPRILDLAFSWVSVVYDGDLAPDDVREALLRGYAEAAALPLTGAETAVWPQAVTYAAAAAAAWCYARDYDDFAAGFLSVVGLDRGAVGPG